MRLVGPKALIELIVATPAATCLPPVLAEATPGAEYAFSICWTREAELSGCSVAP